MSIAGTGLELGRFLSYLTQRQEVIASNIANADIPGYKARDVAEPSDFSDALQAAIVEAPGLPSRNDGNSVNADHEVRLLADNSIRFNLTTQILRSQLKDIRSAIDEGRSS